MMHGLGGVGNEACWISITHMMEFVVDLGALDGVMVEAL